LADHDQDQTAAGELHRPDPVTAGPGAEGDRREEDESAGEAQFSWSPSGVPSPFGQQPPFGTRALSPQSERSPEGPAGPGDAYGPPHGYDTADAYRPPDGYERVNAYGPPGGYDAADAYGPPGGYDAADAYGPPGGYDTADDYDLPDDYGSARELSGADPQPTPYAPLAPDAQAWPQRMSYARADPQDWSAATPYAPAEPAGAQQPTPYAPAEPYADSEAEGIPESGTETHVESAAEPQVEAGAGFPAEPGPYFAVESLAESAGKPEAEPAVESRGEPTAEPLAGSAVESRVEPRAEPLAGSAVEFRAEPAVESQVRSAAEPQAEAHVAPPAQTPAEMPAGAGTPAAPSAPEAPAAPETFPSADAIPVPDLRPVPDPRPVVPDPPPVPDPRPVPDPPPVPDPRPVPDRPPVPDPFPVPEAPPETGPYFEPDQYRAPRPAPLPGDETSAWLYAAQQPALQPPPMQPPPMQRPGVQRPGVQPPGGLRTSETADSLTADVLLPGRHKAPSGGWRRAVYQATGGLIRAPQSAAELRRRELTARARTPVSTGHHRVAVMSLKGGVGKTTTTVGLGATLASVRGDRVIAVDANPDRGTLSDKLRLETSATVRDLLNERDQIQRYADVRGFTTQAPSRLEILASDRDPTVSVAFCEEDYYDVAEVLEHYYSISLADCGTGLLHSAMAGVLRLADQIVLVSSPSVDGARSASATLDWLQAHGYGDLVRQAVVVLSVVRPRSKSTVDMDRLEAHFAARSRAVVRIPYDPHLEEGAEVDLAQLNRATADAYLMLAAEVGDGFARPRRPTRPGPAAH
jgi:MinD-like ATPase involved in chromosome partitioning or flagellar assembly